jgi:hypothetical protein
MRIWTVFPQVGVHISAVMGGSFDLLDADGARKHRVVIPLLELRDRLESQRTQP